jgi:hypothetical protein
MRKINRKNIRQSRSIATRFVADQELVRNVQSRIVALLNRRNGIWNGTMTELNQAITAGLRRATPTNWPKTPSVLRRVINVVVPSLRKTGVRVRFGRTTDHSRKRFVSFEQN